MNNSYIIEVVR